MNLPHIPGRPPLSMTEELEKLEQSITLTLQEIDSNFSRAHRIVTNSILPVIEQYGEHSKAVWEASQFWKQFFEASANVSLSKFDAEDVNTTHQTFEEDESSAMRDLTGNNEPHPSADHPSSRTPPPEPPSNHSTRYAPPHNFPEDSLLTDPDGDVSGSTPRARTQLVKTQFQDYTSPYSRTSRQSGQNAGVGEKVIQRLSEDEVPSSSAVRETQAEENIDGDSSFLFNQQTAHLKFSPAIPIPEERPRSKGKEPLRPHGMGVKKTFRLPTTPHRFVARPLSPVKNARVGLGRATPGSTNINAKRLTERKPWEDSPESSPELAMPKIRSEAFMSPMRTNSIRQKLEAVPTARGPRTPGVSILEGQTSRTAAADYAVDSDPFTVDKTPPLGEKKEYEIDWSSDDDDGALGMSPPKTIQFAMGPQRLIRTPAREASRRIVEDIMETAGARAGDRGGGDETPSLVRMNEDLLEDSF